jgi:hypothetical protein
MGLVFYLIGRILLFRKWHDIVTFSRASRLSPAPSCFPDATTVLYLIVMIIYTMLVLPTIQLFVLHKKPHEALFIRRHHIVTPCSALSFSICSRLHLHRLLSV